MKKIKVGLGTCGYSAGGGQVFSAMKEMLASGNIEAELHETGCNGMCYEEALVEIEDGNDSWLYSKISPDKASRIINEHVVNNKPVQDWIIKSKEISKEDSFLKKQTRIVLRNCGIIDPTSIDDYIVRQGYDAISESVESLFFR